ncbi:hypothetical protein PPTG_24773 [Phytophthora nicotianae INRA-310]|uniref:Uncharacterized protein n=1 Tax=Phytophthora nicotianae (strain INRA-310) TaxID=761204 RepID=W2PBC0_PHYN3|nr:hypothetical protein PPTG_24773 [Phytophthora nicotianae INRA-310]ETM97965.1 hypothetical protein PPTG_24773 [Phytophthora nicotianae INRA-310]
MTPRLTSPIVQFGIGGYLSVFKTTDGSKWKPEDSKKPVIPGVNRQIKFLLKLVAAVRQTQEEFTTSLICTHTIL